MIAGHIYTISMSKISVTTTLLVLLLAILLAGCPAGLGVGPALDGAPVTGLTLPAGSTVTTTSTDPANWGVVFDNTGNEDAVLAYMTAQLLAKGFKEDMSFRDTPGSAKLRGFASGDGRLNVMLSGGDNNGYTLFFVTAGK